MLGAPPGCGGGSRVRVRAVPPPCTHTHVRTHTNTARHSPCPWSLGLSWHWEQPVSPGGEQQRGEPHACAKPPVCWHTCVCYGHTQGRALVPLARLCRASHALERVRAPWGWGCEGRACVRGVTAQGTRVLTGDVHEGQGDVRGVSTRHVCAQGLCVHKGRSHTRDTCGTRAVCARGLCMPRGCTPDCAQPP